MDFYSVRKGTMGNERPTTPASPPLARLLEQVCAAIRVRGMSRSTEKSYVGWIRRFLLFHDGRHPEDLGPEDVTAFLSTLAVRSGVAPATQNQALAAVLFLYRVVFDRDLPWLDGLVRARGPKRLPVVLSRAEVRAVLNELSGTPRLIVTLLYGSGLRLLECCRLRVKDLDFESDLIHVRQAKGNKDRVTLLPRTARAALREQLALAKRLHDRDLRRGGGWVELPAALERKYPNAAREWPW